MIRFLKNVYHQYQHLLILKGRKMAREVLLDKSDRELEDMGFSRTLLNAGISHWPWRVNTDEQSQLLTPAVEKDAIRALRTMTDRELFDLGITRGTIVESVRHGRSGIEFDTHGSDREVA